ncbi:hypothetical protein ACFQ1E_07085 [Sphingomonas canadensis]|uniref:ImmA/IrrE family metallo-endopeptidase n=1 Tax=Sphingomonas canadensis TaxID=1219257 RepID=A0ABW3H4C2_9SPHN|nr:hypothetical protein [Sphingomonas canadensis]MCW3835450.1 hypothetical protein [Sphingomonas canadensis]
MKAADLIKAFEGRTTLPIDVNDVLAVLRDGGHDDDVEFIGADLDPDILQGAIKIWHDRGGVYGGDPKRMVNIYYHRGHSKDWQRMICCKELFHTVDPAWAQTADPEAIDRLAEEIGLPPEMQDPLKEGIETNLDRLAEWRALAILMPLEARSVLKPYYDSKVLSLADIARQADIPTKYAGLVMHGSWEQIYAALTRPGAI